jgi:hypothetical protein
MMKRAINSIPKPMLGRHQPFGYARLNVSLFMSAFILLSVLVYQSYVQGQIRKGREVGVSEQPTMVQVFPQTLPANGQGFYELVVDDENGQSASLGLFSVQGRQTLLNPSGQVINNGLFALPANIGTPTKASLYIRPDAASSDRIKFVEGGFSGDRAHLKISIADVSRSSGQYMLATPTDGDNSVNELSGLWFGTVNTGRSALQLPTLPAGWVYEGWAIVEGRSLTTGRFTNPSGADANAPFSSSVTGPNIPGEDFLRNPPVAVFPGLSFPLDLRNQAVAISIEPDLRGLDPTGAGPFGIMLLQADISRRADPRALYDLDRNDEFPEASVVLR